MWWLFVRLDDLNQSNWSLGKFAAKSWNHSTFCHDVFQWSIWLVQVIQYQKKKLPRKKWSSLLSPSGGMLLMMNTNSKILPSQDSNLSCYSPSTLTFSAPAFYLSSFLILVDQTSTNWKIAPIKIAQGVGVGLGLGLGNSLGAIFRGAILLVPVKGKPHFKAKFSPFKNRTVTWRNAYPSKRAHCFNLLFLFCSQRRKESLNVSNFFYRLTFQPREKYSNFSKTKRKKDQW